LLRDIFQTEEFKTRVLHSVLLREALPHDMLDDTLPLQLIDWVQKRLPIGTFTRRAAGGARTWAQLLELVLSVLSGQGRIANDMYAPLDPGYNHALPQRHQDIEQAKSLQSDDKVS